MTTFKFNKVVKLLIFILTNSHKGQEKELKWYKWSLSKELTLKNSVSYNSLNSEKFLECFNKRSLQHNYTWNNPHALPYG